MVKLSWNPPKWKSYTLEGLRFTVELETGEVYKGTLCNRYIAMKPEHADVCHRIFGQYLTSAYMDSVNELSAALDLKLEHGNWPEFHDVPKFLKRYYERVAKIEKSFTKSFIFIESEIDITPKFTL